MIKKLCRRCAFIAMLCVVLWTLKVPTMPFWRLFLGTTGIIALRYWKLSDDNRW